jgi:HK97 family phage major capsid protein
MADEDAVVETPLMKRLMEKRGRAVSQSRDFVEKYSDGSEMSAEDNEAFKRANSEVDRLGTLIKEEIKLAREERDFSAAYESGVQKAKARKEGSGGGDGPGETRTLADKMRADLQASKDGSTRNGAVLQAVPEHRQFIREQRDLLAGTATKGQETVPVTLVNSLYEKLFDDSAILETGPTILRTASGETLKLPRLTALGALSQANSRVAEAGPIIEGDPSFDQVQLDAYKYAQYTQVSRELVEDGVLDIESLIGQVLGRNIANYVGSDLTLGTGTSQPRGIRTIVTAGGAPRRVDSAAGGLLVPVGGTDLDKFFDVVALLKPAYRKAGKWLVNDMSMFQLRKAKMNGTYAWEPNLQGAGMPDRFIGYPILADPNIPVATSAAGITAIFGDFSAYFVRMVKDVRVEWSMEFAWVNDLISVKAVFRADGDAIDDSAFAGFNSIT